LGGYLIMDKWDKAHLKTAKVYAELSHARRMKVGAVIVKDNRIISIGYNGMPSGWDNNCEDEIKSGNTGYGRKLKTKKEVLHAEANAITKVAKSTESAEGAVLYSTCAPCIDCAKLIHQAGIKRVVYDHGYKSDEGLTFLEKCGIMVETTENPDPFNLPWQRSLVP
jgi:dCMP deaminase